MYSEWPQNKVLGRGGLARAGGMIMPKFMQLSEPLWSRSCSDKWIIQITEFILNTSMDTLFVGWNK